MPEQQKFDGKPYGGCGDVYRWLREHYDYVGNWIAEARPAWDTIADRLRRDGVVGGKGKPPADHSVRRVWKRVCRDMKLEAERRREEEAAKEAAAYARATGAPLRKKYPSDFSKDWRPEEVVKPSADARAVTVMPPSAPTQEAAAGGENLPPVGLTNAQMGRRSRELVRRRLASISGRGPPGKL